MTKKNANKTAARARQAAQGGHYQHHLRQAGGAEDEPDRAIEALLFNAEGTNLLMVVDFVPPDAADGELDPRAGSIVSLQFIVGSYVLVEPSGRTRYVMVDPRAGHDGPFTLLSTRPDTFGGVRVTYSWVDLDQRGTPAKDESYRVVPQRAQTKPGTYAFDVEPLTDGATVRGVQQFGRQAWRELLGGLLDRAHPDRARCVSAEVEGPTWTLPPHGPVVSGSGSTGEPRKGGSTVPPFDGPRATTGPSLDRTEDGDARISGTTDDDDTVYALALDGRWSARTPRVPEFVGYGPSKGHAAADLLSRRLALGDRATNVLTLVKGADGRWTTTASRTNGTSTCP